MSFVAGVGLINVDLIYSGFNALPLEGQEGLAKDFCIRLGGGVVATMALLGNLGVHAKVCTYYGTDLFSGYAERELSALPVEVENLYGQHRGIPLSVTSVAITPNDRTFWSYLDQPATTEADMDRIYRRFRGARVVEMQPGYLPVYRRLKQDGCMLVLDMGWDEEMNIGKYEEYLQLADYYAPNRAEALKITQAATLDEAAQRLHQYFNKVIIKLDSEGCLVLEAGRRYVVGSIPAYTKVDSTGAGDAFLAGFIYGLYHGASLAECVLYGNIAGGNCVAQVGCLASPLSEAELLKLAGTYRHFI